MACVDEETVVAFVRGALRGPALAAVERHLVACPACAALIAVAAPVDADAARPTGAMGAGQVGRYRLTRRVGRGGMGEVWAAHDPELDRKVAIKILRGDARPDQIEAARLAREAQAVARLSHPNVVSIYDVGTDEDGRMFLAMELLEGETLATWLARAPRTPREILDIFRHAGHGLGAAHRAGIVHRDFKPQNVMVTTGGCVRVMDFGLAAAGNPSQPRLTKIGSVLGTPLYMAPEQMLSQPVDGRADQFSFCVALWEALHGARPFQGQTLLELRGQVLEGNPRPGPLRGRVPRRVQAALERGLSVDRAARFPDMDALLRALAGAPAGGRARSVAVGLTAAVLVAGAAALVATWRSHLHGGAACDPTPKLAGVWEATADGPTRQAVRQAFAATANDVPDASARFARASQILDGYAADWRALSREACELDASGSDPVTALRGRCLDRRRDELAAMTDVLAHADAKAVRRATGALLSLGRLDACADLVALRNAPAPPADPATRARVAQLERRLLGLRARAETGHDWQTLEPVDALTADVRAAGDERLLAETLLVDARIRSPFDPDGAIPLYEEARRRAEALHLDDFAAEAAIQLATIEGTIAHRFADGERWAGLAEIALGHGGEHARLRGWFLDARGALDAAHGAWRQAEADFTSAVSVREQALGPEHPAVAASLVGLSRATLVRGDGARALEAADRAAKIAGAVYPADSYEVGTALLARAHAAIALGRAGEARPDVQAVIAAYERNLGRDHPFLADPLTVLGEIALAERRPLDARAALERAWEMRSTHLADEGAREETAFALARAIWGSSESDRPQALELAREAQDGYAAVPDLAAQLALVRQWLEARTAHPARQARR